MNRSAKTVAARIGLAAATVMVLAGAAAARETSRSGMDNQSTGCEAYGPGFHKIDGTESCIKIDGRIRVESNYRTGGGSLSPASAYWLH